MPPLPPCANLADHTNEILLIPERGFFIASFFFYIDVFSLCFVAQRAVESAR